MPAITNRDSANFYLPGLAPFYPAVQNGFLKNHCKRYFLIFIKAYSVVRRDNILLLYCDRNTNQNNSQMMMEKSPYPDKAKSTNLNILLKNK